MVGYMSLEEQVDKDFTHARRKALFKRIGALSSIETSCPPRRA